MEEENARKELIKNIFQLYQTLNGKFFFFYKKIFFINK